MEKKKIKYYVLGLGLLLLSFILFLVIKNTTAATSTTYSRTTLQNYVVSTALSYLYNHEYSDYGQYAMDNNVGDFGKSIYFPNGNNPPEAVNRGNQYYIDCSSFSGMVYRHTLNYDFSEYYDYSSAKIFKKFSMSNTKSSKDNYIYGYSKLGKGMWTEYFANIGKSLSNKSAGTEYKYNDSSNKGIVVYFYEVTGNESSEKKNTIKNNILNVLKPGDIVVYRDVRNDYVHGHAMIYVGDAINSNKGFINATGSDFTIDDDGTVNLGKDTYSVQYDSINKLTKNMFIYNHDVDTSSAIKCSGTCKSTSFTVLRPINRFCNGDSCTVSSDKISVNAAARNRFKNLRSEQYASISKTYNDSNNVNHTVSKTLTNYSQINYGDNLTYNLLLKNKSVLEYCKENGAYSTKSGCEGKGYTWETSNRGSITYADVTVTAPIPEHTTFVSCNNSCTYDEKSKKVTWNIDEINKDTASKTYSYTVKVTYNNTTITNSGFKITDTVVNGSNSTTYNLQMSPINIKTKPTLNGINIDIMKKKVNAISANEYSSLYNIKKVYRNSYGIELNNVFGEDTDIAKSNILNALFVKYDNKNFRKKTSSEISDITNSTYKAINNMLVPGFYGGRILRGNDNGDRINYYNSNNLEFGDIIITFGYSDLSLKSYMFYGKNSEGKATIVDLTNGKVSSYQDTSEDFLLKLKAYGLYAVLRPTRVYGTTVIYDYGGATTTYDGTYVAYDTYKNLVTPKREYTVELHYNEPDSTNTVTKLVNKYNFDGWSRDGQTIKNDTKLVTTSLHTIYANWSSDGIKLPNPTNSGYTFEGWYSDKELTAKVKNGSETLKPTKNMTLYGKWVNDPTLTFDPNGGTWDDGNTNTKTEVLKYKSNYYFSQLPLLSNENEYGECNFTGWKEISTDKVFVSNIIANSNRSFVAQWECKNAPNEYTILYNSNGGDSEPAAQIKKENESLLLSTTKPTKEGYIFREWNTKKDGSGTIYNPGDEYSIDSSITLYAQWNAKLVFDPNGGTWDDGNTDKFTTNVNLGSQYNFSKLKTITKSNSGGKCIQNGWKDDETGYIYTDSVDANSSKNFTAEWACPPEKYTISYNANGGSNAPSSQIKTENINLSLTSDVPEKENYVFKEWNTEKDGTGTSYNPNDEYTLNDSLVLYAQWSPTLTLNPNGGIWKNGVSDKEIITVNDESEILLPSGEDIAKTSSSGLCVLNGWKNDKDQTLYIDSIIVDSSQSLTAQWTCPSEKYVISYDANGGENPPEEQIVSVGSKVTLRNNVPARENYIFTEWNTEKNGNGTSYKANNQYLFDSSVTLYAQWIETVKEGKYSLIIENEVNYLTNISANTTLPNLMNGIGLTSNYVLKVFDREESKIISTQVIPTGSITKIYLNDELQKSYINVIKGDSSGDGNINDTDITVISNSILNKTNFEKEYFLASDVDENNNINVMDIIKIVNAITNNIDL